MSRGDPRPDNEFDEPQTELWVAELACLAPFVNYWHARIRVSVPSFAFSKMLSFQQTGSAAHHRSSFNFRTLQVAQILLFSLSRDLKLR